MEALFGGNSVDSNQQLQISEKLTEFRMSLRAATDLQADLFENALDIRHAVNGSSAIVSARVPRKGCFASRCASSLVCYRAAPDTEGGGARLGGEDEG